MANGQSLFGTMFQTPAEVERLQQQRLFEQARQSAALTPDQQASFIAARSGQMTGRLLSNLAGFEDPELKKARELQGIVNEVKNSLSEADQQDQEKVYSILSKRAGELGYTRESMLLAEQARTARKEAAIEKRAAASDVRAEESLRIQREAAQDVRYKNNPELMLEDARKLPEDDPRKQSLINQYYKVKADQKIQEEQTRAQLDLTKAQTARYRAQAEKEATLLSLTPAQKTVDAKFATEYNSFVNAGGASTVNKLLSDLDKVETALASGQNITGKRVGLQDATGTLVYLNPEAQKAKDLAGGVIQSNLRQILGGQFAQKEGAELLARAYNPAASQEDNLARIRNLRKQIQAALDAKVEAATYYEEKGTLKGYKGTQFVLKSSSDTSATKPVAGQNDEWKILP